MKINYWKMTFIAGLLTVLAFTNLSCLSWSLFPGEFTPLNHQFSDLGISVLNPRGAIFYQLAMILSGIGLYFFFWGLKCWYEKSKSAILCIGLGILVSILQVLQGFSIFPPNSLIIGLVMWSIGKSLYKHPKMPRWFSIFSIVCGLVIFLANFFYPIWLSWLSALSLLLFVLCLSFRTKKAFGF